MNGISRALRDFITNKISSLAELEALLLLFRNEKQTWTASSLSREMRSNPDYAESLLEKLRNSGLVQRNDDQFGLSSISDEQRQLLEELSEAYQSKRHSIIDLVYQVPTEKLRDIADAFKIRK